MEESVRFLLFSPQNTQKNPIQYVHGQLNSDREHGDVQCFSDELEIIGCLFQISSLEGIKAIVSV